MDEDQLKVALVAASERAADLGLYPPSPDLVEKLAKHFAVCPPDFDVSAPGFILTDLEAARMVPGDARDKPPPKPRFRNDPNLRIIEDAKAGMSVKRLSEKYNVRPKTIRDILDGKA